jgi:1-acyl-sn-glycerol-3-phosphate acyltransferase
MSADPAGRLPFGYRLVRGIARLLLRTQYRRIEVAGREKVPLEGPAVLVANHGNSLVDSLAILVASPRAASPLAKAPLFKAWLLRPFLKAVRAVPVFRAQDAEENEGRGVRANADTFRACGERLRAGGAIVLFPEGVSKPQPKLLPLRTGAARIALDVGKPVAVVPVGLTYEAPGAKRGSILVRFGDPFRVEGTAVGVARRGAIATTTRRIEGALRSLIAEAESQGDMETLRALRVVVSQERGFAPAATFAEEDERMRPLAKTLEDLRVADPATLEGLRAQTDAFLRGLATAGIPIELLDEPYTFRRVAVFLLRAAGELLVGAPLAVLAAVVTWPARALGDVLVLRSAGASEDVVAFSRITGQAFALAVLGILTAAALGFFVAWWAGLLALVAFPLLFMVHVLWRDWRHGVRTRIRAFFLLAGGGMRRDLQRRRHDLFQRLEAAWKKLAADRRAEARPGPREAAAPGAAGGPSPAP